MPRRSLLALLPLAALAAAAITRSPTIDEQATRNTMKSIWVAEGWHRADRGRYAGFEELTPDYLADDFGETSGLARRHGYLFRIDLAEDRWAAYAWPQERGRTGQAVLMIDAQGSIREAANEPGYYGLAGGPDPGAAYVDGRLADRRGERTTDGQVWKHG